MNRRGNALTSDEIYTSEDFWNLPDGLRAELINGRLYYMTPPSTRHQEMVAGLLVVFKNFIKQNGGKCRVIPAPFAVNLDASDANWVEPDITVVCDSSKLTDKGCIGAPDMVVEIVSTASRKYDYIVKSALYCQAGVSELWIVDPRKKTLTVYREEDDYASEICPFDVPVSCSVLKGLCVTVSELS